LQRYLAQNLELDVKPIEEFDRLIVGSSTGSTQFKDNVLSFAPAYGLCVQALGKSELKTNLLPEEIVTRRMVRAKKPWAVAGVAAVLAGLTFNYFTHVSAWSDVNVTDASWTPAIASAKQTKENADRLESTRTGIQAKAKEIQEIAGKLTSNVEGRVRWLELAKAIHAALPKDPRPREENAAHVKSRNELHIEAIDTQFFTDVGADYFGLIQPQYDAEMGRGGTDAAAESASAAVDPAATAAATAPAEGAAAAGDAGAAPTGEGWVIQLTGYHFHNGDKKNETRRFVYNTLIKNLETGSVKLPDGKDGEVIEVPLKDLVISHPWKVGDKKVDEHFVIDPEAALYGAGGAPPVSYLATAGAGAFAAPGAATTGEKDKEDKDALAAESPPKSRAFEVTRYDFVVQFIWQPKTRAQRAELAAARAEAKKAADEAAAAAGGAEGAAPAEATAAPEDVTATQ
jgi:type IV pilus assembly protein PilM